MAFYFFQDCGRIREKEGADMKTRYGVEYEKTMRVKVRCSSPLKQKDGTWTTVIEEFEEDIPDLGREAVVCNKCGWQTYPECKEWCKAWVYRTIDTISNQEK